MKRNTIAANSLQTICWHNEAIIDWVSAGESYFIDGSKRQLGKYHYPFKCDSSVISPDGRYAFIYEKLGTKGLLLKNGELLREINRSYYCASSYEYPVVFATITNTTYLIHCPKEYNRIDFENVETGELITNVNYRKPSDIFHSRLEISPNGKFLLSKGWVWHPINWVEAFNIEDCLKNPLLLDESVLRPGTGVEISTASFISDTRVLVASGDEILDDENMILSPRHIGVWNIQENQITNIVKVDSEVGSLFIINDEFAWDTFNYPKIINIRTGKIIDEEKLIYSGNQNSSIIGKSDELPLIAFNSHTKQLAVADNYKIEILNPF